MNFSTQNKKNSEVYHSKENFFSLSKEDISTLISLAKDTTRGRVRFCSHSSDQEALHEMFIVHPRGAYVRPHKHLNKSESLIIIEGEADYVVFDDEGNAKENIPMSDYQFGIYEKAREGERDIEKDNARKGKTSGGVYEDSTSTYRIL